MEKHISVLSFWAEQVFQAACFSGWPYYHRRQFAAKVAIGFHLFYAFGIFVVRFVVNECLFHSAIIRSCASLHLVLSSRLHFFLRWFHRFISRGWRLGEGPRDCENDD